MEGHRANMEQDSTMGPNFALMESCWGVPSPNPAIMQNGKQHDLGHALPVFVILFYWTALVGSAFVFEVS